MSMLNFNYTLMRMSEAQLVKPRRKPRMRSEAQATGAPVLVAAILVSSLMMLMTAVADSRAVASLFLRYHVLRQ